MEVAAHLNRQSHLNTQWRLSTAHLRVLPRAHGHRNTHPPRLSLTVPPRAHPDTRLYSTASAHHRSCAFSCGYTRPTPAGAGRRKRINDGGARVLHLNTCIRPPRTFHGPAPHALGPTTDQQTRDQQAHGTDRAAERRVLLTFLTYFSGSSSSARTASSLAFVSHSAVSLRAVSSSSWAILTRCSRATMRLRLTLSQHLPDLIGKE